MSKELPLVVFSTYDLALASALVVCGFAIYSLERTRYSRASFVFIRSNELDEAVQAFWADDLSVNPKTYFDAMKHIKTRIYSEA